MGVRDCPVNRMTLCVTSDAEKNKCVKMRVRSNLICAKIWSGRSAFICLDCIEGPAHKTRNGLL